MGINKLKKSKMPKAVEKGKKKGAKKTTSKFYIDCKLPIEDNVIVLKDFESYLTQNIKVDGKKGNLGKNVNVGMEREQIVVDASCAFSKRYLKYLTKKYLKKQDLKEFLRVISTQKNTYQLKYFNI